MPKKRLRTFGRGLRLMEEIGRTFPNTAENKGRCKWTHCPFCRGRLQVWRETNHGALRLRCSTIGCFALTESPSRAEGVRAPQGDPEVSPLGRAFGDAGS